MCPHNGIPTHNKKVWTWYTQLGWTLKPLRCIKVIKPLNCVKETGLRGYTLYGPTDMSFSKRHSHATQQVSCCRGDGTCDHKSVTWEFWGVVQSFCILVVVMVTTICTPKSRPALEFIGQNNERSTFLYINSKNKILKISQMCIFKGAIAHSEKHKQYKTQAEMPLWHLSILKYFRSVSLLPATSFWSTNTFGL